MKFTIAIYTDEDGVYIAECPSIPGCVSQGKTEGEAEKNVLEAIKDCLEAVLKLSVSPESEQKIRQIGWIYRRYGAFWLVSGGCFYNFSKVVRVFKTAS